MRYVSATAEAFDRPNTGAPVTLGAELRVTRGSSAWTFHPARSYYPATDGSGGPIGRYYTGESNSKVDAHWSLGGTFWTAVAEPNLQPIERFVTAANRSYAKAPRLQQALAVAALARIYRDARPALTFRALWSPMIVWIWVGGGIVILGSLTALWPSPEARRRRSTSLAAARLGRELSRA